EVHAYGPYLVAKRGSGFSASSLVPVEPTTSEWLFRSASEPVWTIEDDPFLTWEIATHFRLGAAYPDARPETLEQTCIAYDAAIDRHDEEALRVLSEDISAGSISGEPRRFEGGLEVVATRIDGGVQPRVTIVFRAAGRLGRGVEPKLRARVVEHATL